jgi:alkylated DNA repair dioxygenase AlkB
MPMSDRTCVEVAGAKVELWPHFLAADEADVLRRQMLSEVPWRELVSQWMGTMPRLGAWYADDHAAYEYSGVTMRAEPALPQSIAQARQLVADALGMAFPFVLVSLYRDGRDSVGWHADDEELFGGNPTVASLSLGGERRFELKPKPDLHPQDEAEPLEVVLSHGSLFVMWPPAQQRLLHRVPKELDQPTGERINLTFRAPSR